MVMAEVLKTSPACSVSVYGNSHVYSSNSRICSRCINCSAYLNWGLKINLNCAKNHGLSVVAAAANPSFTKQSKLIKREKLCGIAKVASLEFESVCEGVSILEEREGLDENGPRNIFPPWGGVVEQELDGRDHLDDVPKMPLEPLDESKDEINYLEERDEEVLSKRVLKLSRDNKVRSALALYRSMVASGLLPNPHACNSLLSCLLRKRRLDDALKVYEFMRSSGIATGHTYSLILKAVADARGRDEALEMFEEVERDSKNKQFIDVILYNTMISMFGKVNDWVRVNRMWRSLKENRLVGTVVTYRMLVCIFVRCGQNELALDAYHEMAQNGLTPCDDSMQAIVGACTREGKWDLALDVLRSMLRDGIKPSLITCNALINSLGKAAEVELAFKVYDLLKSLGYKPDSYTWNGLICALNRANRHGDALKLFESIRKEEKCVLNLHVYNTCLMSCQRLGLWEKAMQLLWEMEGTGLRVSVTSYNLVIAACEAARKPKVALQVHKHMVKQKQTPDVFTLLSLIRSCIWGSLWKDVEEILNAEPNGSLYNAAIQGTCLRNERSLAKRFYTEMQEIGLKPDGKTRAMMLQNLHRG